MRAAILRAAAVVAVVTSVQTGEQAHPLAATATTIIHRSAAGRRTAGRSSATTIASTGATMATMASHHGVALTAQQGDADHREENRDAKNK
ncbi:MAG TPA: hypothetical protein VG713_17930, partial [Pirellulales bacterium]|nr:hypothetical protein [Pirellulales bacterium]